MATDYKTTFRRYGRFYRNVRKHMQRKEVLVSSNIILTFFTISFFAVFAIRPTALTISSLWREIKDKRSVQKQLEEKISNLEEAQTALASMEEDLELLDNALPSSVEFPRLVKTLEYLASTHNLLISSSNFSNIELYISVAQASESASEIETHSFSLGLTGSFSDIRSFVEDLEQLGRLISIKSISVGPLREQIRVDALDLGTSIDSDTYSFPEEAAIDSK